MWACLLVDYICLKYFLFIQPSFSSEEYIIAVNKFINPPVMIHDGKYAVNAHTPVTYGNQLSGK